MPWDLLLGPWGLVVAALLAVAVLWREHTKADERERVASEAWKARSLASDARLDRIATAFEQATKSSAPE